MNIGAIRTIYSFEMARAFRTLIHNIAAPLLTNILYIVIFGRILGSHMQPINHISYAAFIIPGQIMLTVLEQSIANASFSIYLPRATGVIYEIITAPLSLLEIMSAYVAASATKAVFIGLLILWTALFLVPIQIKHPMWMMFFLIMTSIAFSLLGFIIGLCADSLEKLTLIPMLIVTPLTFLAGSFYSIDMLPPIWQKISMFNPLVYLISGFRWSFHENADVSIISSVNMILAFTAACIFVISNLFNKGYDFEN